MTERRSRRSVYGLAWALIGAAPPIAIVACDTPAPVVAALATMVCRRLAANAPRRVDAVGGWVESVCEDGEVGRILKAADVLSEWGSFGPKARAMVLLLRYSGLRMQDAACLERSRLKDGRLFLYTQKTGTPVYCPLPPVVSRALEGVASENPEYVFWDGQSERETTVKSWNRVFRKIFATADPPVEGGHPHRFRDTFAVSLLLNGVELSHVSILLGHASIKITERHYAPWVKARQKQLEEDVQRTWGGLGHDSVSGPAT